MASDAINIDFFVGIQSRRNKQRVELFLWWFFLLHPISRRLNLSINSDGYLAKQHTVGSPFEAGIDKQGFGFCVHFFERFT